MTDMQAGQPIWHVRATRGAYVASEEMWHQGFDIGLMNATEVTKEMFKQYAANGWTPPYLHEMRFAPFVTMPELVMASGFQPDFYSDKARDFVSPRLFRLLDQPSGSLQAMPTETAWLGDDPPDWSYLWLSYVPTGPAIDLEGSDVDLKTRELSGVRWTRIGFWNRLVLRTNLVPPCGLFQAAEMDLFLLAIDAVANAVVQAGCTGLEFSEVETELMLEGPLRRRGLYGPELHPDGVASRRANNLPVPDV